MSEEAWVAANRDQYDDDTNLAARQAALAHPVEIIGSEGGGRDGVAPGRLHLSLTALVPPGRRALSRSSAGRR